MPAYWIAFVDITQPQQYQEYLDLAPQALQKHGARILARSDELSAMEGFAIAPNRAVVLEFDSYEQALACYHSDEYQHACQFRQGAANAQVVIMRGA